jgi:hypothetical protein
MKLIVKNRQGIREVFLVLLIISGPVAYIASADIGAGLKYLNILGFRIGSLDLTPFRV